VSVSKEHITIVGDGSTQADVEARVKQIKNLASEVGCELRFRLALARGFSCGANPASS
jgi:hypothetical protein